MSSIVYPITSQKSDTVTRSLRFGFLNGKGWGQRHIQFSTKICHVSANFGSPTNHVFHLSGLTVEIPKSYQASPGEIERSMIAIEVTTHHLSGSRLWIFRPYHPTTNNSVGQTDCPYHQYQNFCTRTGLSRILQRPVISKPTGNFHRGKKGSTCRMALTQAFKFLVKFSRAITVKFKRVHIELDKNLPVLKIPNIHAFKFENTIIENISNPIPFLVLNTELNVYLFLYSDKRSSSFTPTRPKPQVQLIETSSLRNGVLSKLSATSSEPTFPYTGSSCKKNLNNHPASRYF